LETDVLEQARKIIIILIIKTIKSNKLPLWVYMWKHSRTTLLLTIVYYGICLELLIQTFGRIWRWLQRCHRKRCSLPR
jgi:hypothetical protein